MKKIKIPPYVRASNPALAAWQSVVATVAKKDVQKNHPGATKAKINDLTMKHPMVLGTNIHVSEAENGGRTLALEQVRDYFPKRKMGLNFHPLVHAYLSEKHFNALMSNLKSPSVSLSTGASIHLLSDPNEFPDSDYAYEEWAICLKNWELHGNPIPSPYVNINNNGGPQSNFGVYTINSNAKIAVLGDFGTGLNDGTTLLIQLMKQLDPDYIIHLGDIYYSGTVDECNAYVQMFTTAFAAAGKTVPVFSIPGNHEYYSGGWGYFQNVLQMNQNNGFSNLSQQASFFSLRTQDGNWQFLGMDTGYNSVENYSYSNPNVMKSSYAPWLDFGEAAWHQDKLANFNGKTVLFSHHQLFSAHSVINDGNYVHFETGTNPSDLKYLNGNLLNVFRPYFPKIAAWFWGHEHILNIFQDNQLGLAKARLIGNSGYEEWAGENPYNPTTSPYKEVTPAVEVGTTSVRWKDSSYEFLNHGFALITLNGASGSVNYYQYPVFSPGTPIPANPAPLQRVNFSDPSL